MATWSARATHARVKRRDPRGVSERPRQADRLCEPIGLKAVDRLAQKLSIDAAVVDRRDQGVGCKSLQLGPVRGKSTGEQEPRHRPQWNIRIQEGLKKGPVELDLAR